MFGKTKRNFWVRANISLESPFESSVSSHWSQVRVLFICVLSVTSLKSPKFWLKSTDSLNQSAPTDWLTGWCRAFFCSCTLKSLYHNRFMASLKLWWMVTKQKQGHFPHFVKPDGRTISVSCAHTHINNVRSQQQVNAGDLCLNRNKKCINSRTGLESIPGRHSELRRRSKSWICKSRKCLRRGNLIEVPLLKNLDCSDIDWCKWPSTPWCIQLAVKNMSEKQRNQQPSR